MSRTTSYNGQQRRPLRSGSPPAFKKLQRVSISLRSWSLAAQLGNVSFESFNLFSKPVQRIWRRRANGGDYFTLVLQSGPCSPQQRDGDSDSDTGRHTKGRMPMTEPTHQMAGAAQSPVATPHAAEVPDIVRDQLPSLSDRDRQHFFAEYERRRKSAFWGWFTWFIGWHFGYIEGRWGLAFLFFIAIGPTLALWWAYEGIFKVRGRLRNQRHEAAIAALRDVRAIAG